KSAVHQRWSALGRGGACRAPTPGKMEQTARRAVQGLSPKGPPLAYPPVEGHPATTHDVANAEAGGSDVVEEFVNAPSDYPQVQPVAWGLRVGPKLPVRRAPVPLAARPQAGSLRAVFGDIGGCALTVSDPTDVHDGRADKAFHALRNPLLRNERRAHQDVQVR